MSGIFLNDWKDGAAVDVFADFDGTRWSSYREEDAIPVQDKPEYQGVEILLASYSRDGAIQTAGGPRAMCCTCRPEDGRETRIWSTP